MFRKIFISHRSISHSLLGLLIAYKVLGVVLPILFNPGYINTALVLQSIMLGYIVHLAADMLTKEGIPLLYPVRERIGFPPLARFRIVTGGFVESFIILPGTAFYIFWFIGARQGAVLYLLRLLER